MIIYICFLIGNQLQNSDSRYFQEFGENAPLNILDKKDKEYKNGNKKTYKPDKIEKPDKIDKKIENKSFWPK